MKAWWQGLSEREQKIVGLGGIAALILLGYALIVSPLINAVNQAQQTFHSKQALLHTMEKAEARVQALRRLGLTPRTPATGDLLVLAESSLQQNKLSRYLKQVQQPQAKRLQLQFKAVPFDALIHWLEQLWQQSGVLVVKIQVDQAQQAGAVDAELTLTK